MGSPPGSPHHPAAIQPASPAALQPTLDDAVEAFARLWARSDAEGLVGELVEAEIRLHLGGEREGLLGRRQARAALRDFLSQLSTVDLEVERVSEVGGSPRRGFAELRWTAAASGSAERLRYTLFAGFVREETGWRLAEVRILR